MTDRSGDSIPESRGWAHGASRPRGLPVAVLFGTALLFAPGCDEAPAPSAEVRVVETLRLEAAGRNDFELLSDELALRSPSGMLWDGEHLFVSDAGRGSVLVIDSDGRLEATVGRSGSGPGEFVRPQGLWTSEGELVVFGGGNSRLSRWDLGNAGLLEELSLSSEPGIVGTVAWIDELGYLLPTSAAEPVPVRLVDESGVSGPLAGWPERPRTHPDPIVVDLLAHAADRIVVLENLGSRLLVGDGSGNYEFELALPIEFVDPIMEFLEARRPANAPVPLLPQLGRFLSIDSEGVATLLFIRPVGSVVGLSIDLELGAATRIEVGEGILAHGAGLEEITSLVRVGNCYFVGSSAGVQELCGGDGKE